MSFSKNTKRELLKTKIEYKELYLDLLLKTVNVYKDNKIIITLYSNSLVRRTIEVLKDLKITYELKISNKEFFDKSKKYTLTIDQKQYRTFNLGEILELNEEIKNEYLKYAFILTGSINDPNSKTYHLEFLIREQNIVIILQTLINEKDLNAKITKRRDKYLVYIKKAEEISELLFRIKAKEHYFKFLNAEVKKELVGNCKKAVAFSISNQEKTNKASNEFINLSKRYNPNKHYLNELQKRLLNLRVNNSEASLNELTKIYLKEYSENITKSKIQHQLLKIKEILKAEV